MKLEKLKQFRQTLDMSKVDMARLLAVSLSYYEKIESGERNPSYNFITRFSREFPESDINSIFFDYKMCEETADEDVY